MKVGDVAYGCVVCLAVLGQIAIVVIAVVVLAHFVAKCW